MNLVRSVFIFFMVCIANMPASAETARIYTSYLPPFSIDNTKLGIAHELMYLAGEDTGITFEVVYVPWKRAQQRTLVDTDSMLMSANRTQDREHVYKWVSPLITANWVFFSAKTPINSYEQARSLRSIGVLGGTIREEYARQNNLANLYVTTDAALIARMLNSNRIDAWLTLDLRGQYVFRTEGLEPARLIKGKPLRSVTLWLAANPSFDPQKAHRIQAALTRIMSSPQHQMIVNKYTNWD